MTAPSTYVLDADVFIEAAKRYYAFDIAPSFWKSLINHAESGRIVSIDRVLTELERGKDALADWASGQFHQWFASTAEDDVIATYRKIMAWAQSQTQFTDAAKAEFAKETVADGWVIAYAMAKGCVVVTHEQLSPDVKRRIPIPNVCTAFNVRPIDTFAMLRDLGVKLG